MMMTAMKHLLNVVCLPSGLHEVVDATGNRETNPPTVVCSKEFTTTRTTSLKLLKFYNWRCMTVCLIFNIPHETDLLT